MKRLILTVFLLWCGTIFAHGLNIVHEGGDGWITEEMVRLPTLTRHGWERNGYPVFPVQLAILSGPERIPLQLCDGKVMIPGVSLGLVWLTQKASLISFAPLNGEERNWFLQTALLLSATEKNYGIQFSPFYTLALDHEGYWNGFQVGGFNLGGSIQIGILNHAFDGKWAFQIGLFNQNEEGKNIFQIGLLNYNHESLIPWCPIINFSMPWLKKEERDE